MTDTTPNTVQIRAVVTAKDADDVWTVRCAVRERMIAWLVEHHPYALPRVTTAEAAPGPSGSAAPGPAPGAGAAAAE